MKTYRAMLYGDLHLQLNDPLGVPTDDGLTTRIHQKIKSLKHVIELAIKHDCDWLVDLGDTFNSINPASKLRNAYAKEVRQAIQADMHCYRVIGNHETNGQDADGADAGLLSGDYTVATSSQYAFDPDGLLFIPEVDEEHIQNRLLDDATAFVFGHFGIHGATYSLGFEEAGGIPQSLFSDRPFPSFFGHIHKRQIMVNGKVVYIGALCRHDFGDRNIPTGCCLVTIECDKIAKNRFLPIQSWIPDKVIYEFIDIPDINLHKVVFVEGNDTAFAPECDRKLISEGDIIKVVYEGSHDWYASLDRSVEKSFIEAGARVLVEFNPVAQGMVDMDVSVDTIDLPDFIRAQAKKDGQVDSMGINYYLKAMEIQSG